MAVQVRVYINAQTHEGRRGYAMTCGHVYQWYSTLAQAKNHAEKIFAVKKWNSAGKGEYEGTGSDAYFESENAEFLANAFGKGDTEDNGLYESMNDTIGKDDLFDKQMAEIVTKAIGINDVADVYLVKLLAKASGIDDASKVELANLLAETKRANHRDTLSLRERLRAKNKKTAPREG